MRGHRNRCSFCACFPVISVRSMESALSSPEVANSQDDPMNGSRTGRPAESGLAGAVGKDKHT
jgi:hypothetical protein